MKIKTIVWSALIDVACIIIFVLIGRKNHDEGETVSGIIQVAAPFLIALGVSWIIALAWRNPLSSRSGITIWLITILLAMPLRHLLYGDGTATAFIIVATVFLGTLINGWRALARKKFTISS